MPLYYQDDRINTITNKNMSNNGFYSIDTI